MSAALGNGGTKVKRVRKPLFSKRGNPEDYSYMAYQVKFIVLAAIFVAVIVLLVETGILR